ncbi:MAG: DsrE family protein [Pseudomonadota bacterium]
MSTWWKWSNAVDISRRRMVSSLALLAGFIAATGAARAEDMKAEGKSLRFPGDPPENYVVYQLNKPEAEYHDHIVFSVGAMLRQYSDNIKIAVVAFGPGIHVLLKNPRRPVTQTVREKIASLSDYGVDFYACGNTLKSLKLAEKDVVPFAKVVEVGASTLMELQKQGYAYISW